MSAPLTNLPSYLLLDVSGRLHDPVDFVRFHTLCMPWRDTTLLNTPTARPRFPPRLLRPHKGISSHCSTSEHRHDCKDIILAEPPGASSIDFRNWVASTDGRAAWLFTWSTQPRLVNLLTGDITPLPGPPEEIEDAVKELLKNPVGIVYGDGTVFLYNHLRDRDTSIITAAMLRPGDVTWRIQQKSVDVPRSRHLVVAYHNRAVFLCAGDRFVYELITIDGRKYVRDDNYLVESRGELIWTSILRQHGWQVYGDPPLGALLVKMKTREGANGDSKRRWVDKEVQSLGDRVFFLIGMAGGCAYFVFVSDLYRYNLLNGEAKLVKELDPEWGSIVHLWLQPQPTIVPIQEIRERLEASNKRIKENHFSNYDALWDLKF
ncbi:hypothetical protein VPH35_085171 [Triticum aestivum]